MIEEQGLIETDRVVTLSLNGSDSLFFDGFFSIFTSMGTWIVVALIILFILFRNNTKKNLFLIIVLFSLTIVCCDQLSSAICKPLFERFRPTQDPNILNLVDTVNGYRGGQFGFFSGHAANSFGIVFFLILLFKDVQFSIASISWALINSYSRIYLGVHFVGDVVVGIIVGVLFGTLFYFIYKLLTKKDRNPRYSNVLYTSSGYLHKDISLFRVSLYGTYLIMMFIVCVGQGLIPY